MYDDMDDIHDINDALVQMEKLRRNVASFRSKWDESAPGRDDPDEAEGFRQMELDLTILEDQLDADLRVLRAEQAGKITEDQRSLHFKAVRRDMDFIFPASLYGGDENIGEPE